MGSHQYKLNTATSFSGNATGVKGNAIIGLPGASVTNNILIAPTGELPSTGGRNINGVAQGDVAGSVVLGGPSGAVGLLSTRVVATRTSGGAAGSVDGGTANTSQSQAVVNDLALSIATVSGVDVGLNVTAATVTANTGCQCTINGPACAGNSVVENLNVNGALIGRDVLVPNAVVTTVNGVVRVAAQPNTTLVFAQLNGAGVRIGTVTITLNEQISNGAGDITVNALRIQVTALDGTVTTDIIVAQAHSDIVCAPAAPSADLQVTNSCVNNNNVITCTTIVTNNGPGTATGIGVTQTLSPNTTFVSATGNGVTVNTTPAVSATGGTVTGSVATLGSGQSVTLTTVSNVGPGTASGTIISNTATVTSTSPDPNAGNNTSTGTAAVGGIDSFSGNATGALGTATVLGTVNANILVAPVGPLPAAGGSLSSGLVNGSVNLGAIGTTNSLLTGVFETRTSGGAAGGTPNSSRSRATVNNLNLSLLGGTTTPITVTATTVEATTFCQCTNTGPSCSGSTTIENLRVNGALILNVSGSETLIPAPNTTLVFAQLDALGNQIGTITLILNEQTRTGAGDITVNALRIQVAALNGTVTTDIIVAQAHSDIVCSDLALGPTAASAAISGRVLTSKGRGLPGATVVLTNQNGEVKYAVINPRGYYRFADIEVGEDYFLSVKSKRYVFATQSISFIEELTDIDFMPTQ